MIESQRFRRFPAIRCWIKNVLEGKYNFEDKSLFTIFGKMKRVRIVATIIDKREILSEQLFDEEDRIEEEKKQNLRIEFDLDDGSGLIRAVLWGVDPEHYKDFVKGDIVDIVGLIRYWKEYISISPEIMKKVKEPNFILLRNAEIIKKIKSGEIQKIPEENENAFGIDEISSEIDVNGLFENKETFQINDTKEEIYKIIKKNSLNGNGINFKELKELIQIPEDQLRKLIQDLEMESRIYESEQNIYNTY